MVRLIINRLARDAWNIAHIAKYGVLPEEAEEVAVTGPVIRETYKGRSLLIGLTAAQRVLTVIVGPVPNQPNAYYVFSARPASRKERRLYAEEKGGQIE